MGLPEAAEETLRKVQGSFVGSSGGAGTRMEKDWILGKISALLCRLHGPVNSQEGESDWTRVNDAPNPTPSNQRQLGEQGPWAAQGSQHTCG